VIRRVEKEKILEGEEEEVMRRVLKKVFLMRRKWKWGVKQLNTSCGRWPDDHMWQLARIKKLKISILLFNYSESQTQSTVNFFCWPKPQWNLKNNLKAKTIFAIEIFRKNLIFDIDFQLSVITQVHAHSNQNRLLRLGQIIILNYTEGKPLCLFGHISRKKSSLIVYFIFF